MGEICDRNPSKSEVIVEGMKKLDGIAEPTKLNAKFVLLTTILAQDFKSFKLNTDATCVSLL